MNRKAPTEEYTEAQQHAIDIFFPNLGRLTDFVKGLNSVDGKPTELINCFTAVEGIYDLFKDLPKNTAEYGVLIRSIRKKNINEASDVFNANNVFYDWPEIRKYGVAL